MRGYVAAVLVVAVTALAGCTDDPQPRFDEPTEPPSASASTSAAAEPEPWEEKSKAGAVAFARHWVDVFNEAQTSGEVDELTALSAPSCKTCNGYVSQLEELYGDGGRLESDGWRVLVVAPPPGRMSEQVDVTLRVDRPSQRVFNGNGRAKKFPGGKATYTASLAWGDGWRMERLVRFV